MLMNPATVLPHSDISSGMYRMAYPVWAGSKNKIVVIFKGITQLTLDRLFMHTGLISHCFNFQKANQKLSKYSYK